MKVSLIGYGYWGKIIERYLNASSVFDLLSIFDTQCLDHPLYTHNLYTIWNNPQIEAVFICTPTASHFLFCREALMHGKHVFCEKPTTNSLLELDQLAVLAQAKNKVLYTDYLYVTSRSIIEMKNKIDSIGTVRAISCAIQQYGKFYGNESAYETIGVHMLSAIFFLAEPQEYAIEHREIVPNRYGIINMELPGQIQCCVICNQLSTVKERKITVYGKEGLLSYSMNDSPSLSLYQFDASDQSLRLSRQWNYDEKNNISASIEQFNRFILTKDLRSNLTLSRQVRKALSELK